MRAVRWLPLAAALLGLAAWIALLPDDWRGWFGFSSQATQQYAFVSGVGPMVLTALLGSSVLVSFWHHVNCRAPGCLFFGHYPDSRGVKWCGRHHPEHQGKRPTLEMLHRLHFEHKERSTPGGG